MIMQIMNFEQPEENVRCVEIGKNKLFMKRTNPYGHVYINYERGDVPEELKGAFTSFDEAKKRIVLFLEKREDQEDKKLTKEKEACKKLGIKHDSELNDSA